MSDLQIAAAAGMCLLAVFAAVLNARRSAAAESSVTAALSLAVAFFLGHITVVGVPEVSSWEHQPAWIAGVAFFVVIIMKYVPRVVVSLAGTGALAVLVVYPCASAEWTTSLAAWIGWGSVLLFAFAHLESVSRFESQYGRLDGPIVLAFLSIGLAVVCLNSEYLKFAILAGVLGVVFLPAGLGVVLRDRRLSRACWLVFTLLWLTVFAGPWFHTLPAQRVHWAAFVLLGLAPMSPWVAELVPLDRSRRPWLRVALIGIVVGFAIALAFTTQESVEDPTAEYDWDW